MSSDDCEVIICSGNAKLTDSHLASIVHCVDDEIVEFLDRRERRKLDRLARNSRSAYKHSS
jgi:hypothetical protein